MKKNILNDLKTAGLEELVKALKSYKNEADKISIQLKSHKLKDVMLLAKKKKVIAQILTVLREKELAKT